MRRVGKGSRREGEPQGRGETRGSNCLGQRVRAGTSQWGRCPGSPSLCSPMTGDLDGSACATDIPVRPCGQGFRDGTPM